MHDDLLDATVVHVEADPPGSSTTRVLDEVLGRMVAAVAAEDIARAVDPRRRPTSRNWPDSNGRSPRLLTLIAPGVRGGTGPGGTSRSNVTSST